MLNASIICRQSNLARALAFEGANARLKRVIRKARKGEKIKIGILGGSVTAGHGVKEPSRWSSLYGDWWRTTFPDAEIQVINGAVPASETSYYMTCFGEHIDRDVDVVVIEMGINDRRYVLSDLSRVESLTSCDAIQVRGASPIVRILAPSFAATTQPTSCLKSSCK
jgi:lysophospholipase L1-like esterase